MTTIQGTFAGKHDEKSRELDARRRQRTQHEPCQKRRDRIPVSQIRYICAMKNHTKMLAVVLIAFLVPWAFGEEVDFAYDTPKGWRSETVRVPLAFAPGMKMRGMNELRFAPGMFDAKSELFFTYVFAMTLEPDQPLTEELIQQELLTYYRGLARAVGKATDDEVAKFSLKTKRSAEPASAPPTATKTTEYRGKLTWIEPFATKQSQELHLEIQSFGLADSQRNYLFVCVSPQEPSNDVWKKMRGFRKTLRVMSNVEKPAAGHEEKNEPAPTP